MIRITFIAELNQSWITQHLPTITVNNGNLFDSCQNTSTAYINKMEGSQETAGEAHLFLDFIHLCKIIGKCKQ